MEPLTDEQVANWRNMLCLIFGPWALIMPREEIELQRLRMQQDVAAAEAAMEAERG